METSDDYEKRAKAVDDYVHGGGHVSRASSLSELLEQLLDADTGRPITDRKRIWSALRLRVSRESLTSPSR